MSHALKQSWLNAVKRKAVKMGLFDCVSKIPCSAICERGMVYIKRNVKAKTGISWRQFESIHQF